MSPMLTKDLVASTRVTYPHHWPIGDILGRAPCSLWTWLPTLQPSSWDWRADIDRAHAELYLSWSKTQFRINTATQACMWTTLRLPLHVHVLYVHAFIQKVLWRREKVCSRPFKMQSALQNAVGQVSRNRDLFRCGLRSRIFIAICMWLPMLANTALSWIILFMSCDGC